MRNGQQQDGETKLNLELEEERKKFRTGHELKEARLKPEFEEEEHRDIRLSTSSSYQDKRNNCTMN